MRNFVFLATLLVSFLLSPAGIADTSGKCGDDITWSVDESGNLLLTGSGEMYNFNGTDSGYHPWSTDIKSVIISDGITSIGSHAFDECIYLTSVELPNTLTSIGYYAFDSCSSLKNIELPNSLTTLGYASFSDCTSLEGIIIPELITKIEGETFYRCYNLSSVKIPDSVKSIDIFAFYYCINLSSIEFPNSVTIIDYCAFTACSSLTSIEIPSSVNSIGEGAFSGCSSLESIKVAEDNPNYDSRDYCNAIIETSTNKLLAGCVNTVIPNSVTIIADFAFGACTRMKSLEISSSVTSIASTSFATCSGLESIKVAEDNLYYDSRNDCNAIIEKSTNTLIRGCANTIIPSSVEIIGYAAFDSYENLISMEIPNSVTQIIDNAFSGCSNLKSIEIPNSVTHIGSYVFYGCSSLEKVTLGSSVTILVSWVFNNCPSLKQITSYAVEPPRCLDQTFEGVDKNECILIVPDESISKYQNAEEWKDFINIAGVETLTNDDEISVKVENGEIIVNGAEDKYMKVYSASGIQIYSGGVKSLYVPTSGIYIVNVAGKAFKVAVR